MLIEHLTTKLNASSWRGCIEEVGVGMPFSSKYVSIPGASQTILDIHSAYADPERPGGMRAVSLENVKRQAYAALALAKQKESRIAFSNTEHLFGLAINGAHYEKRSSHVWVYLATPRGDSYMHFYTSYPVASREEFGEEVIKYVSWFVFNCLLESDWVKGITEDKWSIDVLYAAGVSDFERLLLLREDNPLAVRNGKFVRVEDVVRDANTIYSGSFNPPTRRHIENAKGCLCEISQKHIYKGNVNTEDLLHRIRMLQAAGCDVLITKACKFIDKYTLLLNYIDVGTDRFITFRVGVDAWNATIASHQYPNHDWLGQRMPFAKFEILPRAGYKLEHSPVADNLEFTLVDTPATIESSTSVRNADVPHEHDFLTFEVAKYIRQHNLYAQQNSSVS